MQGFAEQAIDELSAWWLVQRARYKCRVRRVATKQDTGWRYVVGHSGGYFVRVSDGYHVLARSFLESERGL
jgi:hypothetical protein